MLAYFFQAWFDLSGLQYIWIILQSILINNVLLIDFFK